MCHEEAAASTQPNLVCTFAHCLSPSPSPLHYLTSHVLLRLTYAVAFAGLTLLTIPLLYLDNCSFFPSVLPPLGLLLFQLTAPLRRTCVCGVFASAHLNLRLGHACLLILLLFSSPTSCWREHSHLSVRSSDLPLHVVRTCTRTYLIFRTGAYAVLERAPSHGPFLTAPLAWGSLTFMASLGFSLLVHGVFALFSLQRMGSVTFMVNVSLSPRLLVLVLVEGIHAVSILLSHPLPMFLSIIF